MDDQAWSVVDNGSNSTWRPITSGLLLESVLRHVLLNMSINELGEVPECTLVAFADDAKLGGPGDSLEGKGCHPAGPRLARGMGRQELIEIQKGQMRSPARGKEDCGSNPGWGLPGLGTALLERSLWVLRSQAEHEPAVHSGSKGGQTTSWAV